MTWNTPSDYTDRPYSTISEDRYVDELRALRDVPEPTDALTIGNFTKALFVAIALFLVIGCVFAVFGQ